MMLCKYVPIAVTTIGFLNLVFFVHNVNYYIATPTNSFGVIPTNTPESNLSIEPLNKHNQSTVQCTAELLLSGNEEGSRWISLDGIWKWKVSIEAALTLAILRNLS